MQISHMRRHVTQQATGTTRNADLYRFQEHSPVAQCYTSADQVPEPRLERRQYEKKIATKAKDHLITRYLPNCVVSKQKSESRHDTYTLWREMATFATYAGMSLQAVGENAITDLSATGHVMWRFQQKRCGAL
jgi:hypothetical protein